MLTRFVRIQLTVFIIAAVIGLAAMFFRYMQVPTLLGIGRLTVKLELPDTGGLYRFSNVTYRGVQVGEVTALKLTPNDAEATLSLGTSPKIPANLQAQVRSVSAKTSGVSASNPNTTPACTLIRCRWIRSIVSR